MGLHISRIHRYGKASPKIVKNPENWDKISLGGISEIVSSTNMNGEWKVGNTLLFTEVSEHLYIT